MYLLDTDVLSASRRPEKAAPEFADWVIRTNPVEMYISAVSVLEVTIGALRIGRGDEMQGTVLQRWIQEGILEGFHQRIIAVDSTIALRCAELHVPDPSPERDAMIAATALVHHLTVVTRNVRHFRRLRARVFNPWAEATA